MAFNNNLPRTAELTAYSQTVCARFYANARNAKSAKEAIMWQNSAAAHFVKTAHRMNLLEPMLATCYFAFHRRQALASTQRYHLPGCTQLKERGACCVM